jgi:alpha-L-glutamate ligase-like protein
MLGLARRLRANGVLGINARNALYMLPHNPRRLYPLADDKLRTKEIAAKVGIKVPELYAVVASPGDVRSLHAALAGYQDFVVKPAHGSGGEGIIVVTGRAGDNYRLSDGTLMDHADMAFHVNNLLSGIYSLGGQADKALVEYRVRFDPVFDNIAYQGVPDVRIVVYFGYPVMAMVRLPTRASRGRANLHQGAIGAGVDIATGTTLMAVLKTGIVADHPDTGHPVSGICVPYWQALLDIAARSWELTGLAYQGVDIVLDRDLGPLVLELNARPGLAIQIANRAGLRRRLELVDKARGDGTAAPTAAERVAFAKARFAAVGA